MPGKAASKRPASKTPAIQRARELSDAKLEEGDHWFAVAMPWWEAFQACKDAKDAPSVQNDLLIDKPFSSKTRNVALLKPKLQEGSDFEFVPKASWEVIAKELDFDWEIRREVIYLRSQQELVIEPYPFAFKVFYWTNEETEPTELVDAAGQAVVVLGSRAHTLGQLLTEVWLSTPDKIRRRFPQFLSCIDTTSTSPSPMSDQLRVCYHGRRAGDDELEWTPVEKMMKCSRLASTSPKLKPRAKKRKAGEEEGSNTEEQSADDEEEEEAEYEHAEQLKGGFGAMNTKFGDLRLDNRSKCESGAARLHELLVEKRAKNAGDFGWPSQGVELHWRMGLDRGDLLDALDTMKTWCEARVLAARRNKVHVHYRGWDSKFDEWISRLSPRLAPTHSHVSKWRSALREHTVVQVGIQVPHRQHPKWRNATVLEVSTSSDKEQEHESVDGAGLRVHIQVDEDDLWLPAYDDMLSQPSSHIESKKLTQEERKLLAHDDSLLSDSEIVEEATAETEDKGGEGRENEEEEGDTIDLMDHDGSSSPPVRPPRTRSASQTRMDLRSRVGPARNLNASFSKVQDKGQSSAGRTPAHGRSRRSSRSRAQVSNDDTSPETVSPTLTPSAGQSAGQVNTQDLQTLWTHVGNDLRSLQSNWEQLGQIVMAFVDAQSSERSQ